MVERLQMVVVVPVSEISKGTPGGGGRSKVGPGQRAEKGRVEVRLERGETINSLR